MKKFLQYIAGICCISLFTGCVARYGVPTTQESPLTDPPEICLPLTFYASSGAVSYKNQVLNWVNTEGGSIELNGVQVTEGASTDKDLIAFSSEISNASIGGELWLEHCNLCGTSRVSSNGWIKDSKVFGDFSIDGRLQTYNSTFYQSLTVNGNVEAQNTHFDGTLQAAAEIIQLDHVCVNHIIVSPIEAQYDSQLICLKNHSIVYGDIYFTSTNGRIVLDPTSHIYGNIYGGTLLEPFRFIPNETPVEEVEYIQTSENETVKKRMILGI